MKIAIVTGSAGFIGSHLTEKLLEQKFRVIGIDCFTDYYSKKIKKNNMKNFLTNKNFQFIEKDVMKMDLLPVLKKGEYLFHQAAQPGVRASWGNSFNTYCRDNILSTQRILEFAKSAKSLKKIIMASSSSIYGNQSGKMIEEKTTPKPVSPYGTTKLASENLGNVYFRNYGLPIISLRYFTVFGPRQRPDMAFNRFILNVLKDKPITVFGDGTQSRDFTFVDDIVKANISAMNSKSKGEIFNIGGGNIVSINKVINTLEEISGKKIKISKKPFQKGDVMHTNASITKARKLLQFEPKPHFKKNLKKEFEFIKENFSLYN